MRVCMRARSRTCFYYLFFILFCSVTLKFTDNDVFMRVRYSATIYNVCFSVWKIGETRGGKHSNFVVLFPHC